MIDLHSHVLPQVDDGAVSVRMALDMLDAACRSGTREIVLTPHYAHEYGFENPKQKVEDLFEQFQDIVRRERIPIRMYLGTEYLMSDREQFKQEWKTIRTLNDSRYLLMEFFFDAPEREMLLAVDAVQEIGLIPVIAHPERYDCVKRYPAFAEMLTDKGALLQMNKGSPLGFHGRHTRDAALELLSRHQYALAGSDTHRPEGRDPNLSAAYAFVGRHFSCRYADQLFWRNAEDVLQDIDIREVNADEEY